MNYLALLFTIALAVMIGNLASNWITAMVVEYQARQAMQELQRSTAQQVKRSAQQMEAATAKAQANMEASRLAEEERARERRRNDREGVRLAQACEEWRRADAQLKSDTTRYELSKHCGRYDRYVQTGSLATQ